MFSTGVESLVVSGIKTNLEDPKLAFVIMFKFGFVI